MVDYQSKGFWQLNYPLNIKLHQNRQWKDNKEIKISRAYSKLLLKATLPIKVESTKYQFPKKLKYKIKIAFGDRKEY